MREEKRLALQLAWGTPCSQDPQAVWAKRSLDARGQIAVCHQVVVLRRRQWLALAGPPRLLRRLAAVARELTLHRVREITISLCSPLVQSARTVQYRDAIS